MHGWLAGLALTFGCLNPMSMATGSTGDAEPDETTGTASTSTTDFITSSSTGEAAMSSSDSTGAASIGVGFMTDPDSGPSSIECSVIEQDCPRGEKCNAWSNHGGPVRNATRCFPVSPGADLVDEVCTVEGSAVSGLDSCERGAICLRVDARTGQGICVPYCTGSDAGPSCTDAARTCRVDANAILVLCLPDCDPLDPVLCAEGEGCYTTEDGLVCAPDASGKDDGPFAPCAFVNGCDPGSLCADSMAVGACEDGQAKCCTPFCDLTVAPSCPGGTVCLPYFDDGRAPQGLVDLGFCGEPPI